MREVKLCPFCGEEATIVDYWEDDPAGYAFRCMGCGIETPHFEDAEDAARFWNRRARADETLEDAKK